MHFEVGKEYVAGTIIAKRCVNFLFITIIDKSPKYILGTYQDHRGSHTIKFSAKTGKEWRPQHWQYYRHLTEMEVHRHEQSNYKSTNINTKSHR